MTAIVLPTSGSSVASASRKIRVIGKLRIVSDSSNLRHDLFAEKGLHRLLEGGECLLHVGLSVGRRGNTAGVRQQVHAADLQVALKRSYHPTWDPLQPGRIQGVQGRA